MATIGFIGLGLMGNLMAEHLIKAGHKVNVFDIEEACLSAVSGKGGLRCTSCGEVASRAEIVFIIVPDTMDVQQVLFGKDGVASRIKSGSIVVDMSSISPLATREFAQKLDSLGVKMLDAPVSGGQIGAEQATLSIMVGGDFETFTKVKPFFELMGKNITYQGGSGNGQICKVANQIVVGITIEAISEALLFASVMGADASKVREALLGGFAQSRILDVHGKRMLERNFKAGFRIRHQQKDLNLALQGARAMGMSLPCTTIVQEMYNSLGAHETQNLDHSALLLTLEKLANHQLG